MWNFPGSVIEPMSPALAGRFFIIEPPGKPNHWVFCFLFLTLQYCVGFAIYQHESATGIHVFPILSPPPYHPSGLSQCTSPKHPVSCIKPGLATRFIYDIIHVSMPFSHIIPPSPSPTESKRLPLGFLMLLTGGT